MSVARNDACPCGSGKKYKKCCLGAPDPTAVRKSRILLYGTLVLAAATVVVFFVVGQSVGSAVGLGSFFLVLGYALAGSSSSGAAAPPGKPSKPAKSSRARR